MPSRFLLIALITLCAVGVTFLDWTLTRIGNAHIECLKRLFTSPSGNAIKNVITITAKRVYQY